MRKLPSLALATLLLVACNTVPTNSNGWIEPAEAVRAANDDPALGIRGHFVLTVRAVGSQGDRTFLNSEKDYRDQTNLTISMRTAMAHKVAERLGVTLDQLKNRRIVVLGHARRVRIGLFDEGRPTGKYYYQTHVWVDSPTQVEFAR